MWLAIAMGRDVAMDERLRVVLVCAPEILRLGLERVLAQDPALSVRAHRRLEAVRAPADVVVLCERGLADIAATCAAAAEHLDAGVVLVTRGTDPHVVLDCLAAGATGFVAEGGPGAAPARGRASPRPRAITTWARCC